jgi:hypothetical protein
MEVLHRRQIVDLDDVPAGGDVARLAPGEIVEPNSAVVDAADEERILRRTLWLSSGREHRDEERS